MTAREGFPDSFGSHRATVILTVGPASYTQYTAPSTGGQEVNVQAQGGVKVVDWAAGSVSADGLHRAEVVQIEAGPAGSNPLLADARLVLKWYVVATGSEVAGAVDLSAAGKQVRIFVIGPK